MAGKKAPEDMARLVSDLEDFVGYNLKRAYMRTQNDFRTALGEDGLGPREFSALSVAMQSPNITQSALARVLKIERSGLVAIVDALERRGYLQRTDVPGDRRVQALVPTRAGQEAYGRALEKVRTHEDALFAEFTGDEKATLMRLLKKLRGDETV